MPSRLRLLLVNENAGGPVVAREAFEGMAEAIGLRTCCSGKDALQTLRDTQCILPDVVVIDVSTPGLDSFGLLTAIKTDPQLVHLPVVMLSDSELPADVHRAYSLRASAYVVKARESAVFHQQISALVGFWKLCRVIGRPIRTVAS